MEWIVKFTEFADVYKFNTLMKDVEGEVDIMSVHNARHCVDAKSILGIFSLDLSSDLLVKSYLDEDGNKALEEKIKEFIKK